MSESELGRAVVRASDMSPDMQQIAVDCAAAALHKYTHEKDVAAYVKKEFDKRYRGSWHCIVGRDFGSYVSHDSAHAIFFFLGEVGFFLWRTATSEEAVDSSHGPLPVQAAK